jgi:hypothetical protein
LQLGAWSLQLEAPNAIPNTQYSIPTYYITAPAGFAPHLVMVLVLVHIAGEHRVPLWPPSCQLPVASNQQVQ